MIYTKLILISVQPVAMNISVHIPPQCSNYKALHTAMTPIVKEKVQTDVESIGLRNSNFGDRETTGLEDQRETQLA